ncbi:hypothetical protein [Carnobacterium jeotgali]|uniref:hypothetical protein n=1 Tax=Carnobacterium jeotgali TaxID=545534 RepID=UPI0004933B7D|nr:hypothetical protein [Carnobacterium jeotgali]
MNKKVLYGTIVVMAMVIGGLGTWIVTDNLNDKAIEKKESSKQQGNSAVEDKMVKDIQDKFFPDNEAIVTHSKKDDEVSIIVTAKSDEMLSKIEDEAIWEKTYKPLMEKVSKYVADNYGSKHKVKLSKPKSDGKEYLLILVNGSIQKDLFPYTKKEKEKTVEVVQKTKEDTQSAEEKMITDINNKFFDENEANVSYTKEDGQEYILVTAVSSDMSTAISDPTTWENYWHGYIGNLKDYTVQNYGTNYKLKVVNSEGTTIFLDENQSPDTSGEDIYIEVTNEIVRQFGDTFEVDVNGASDSSYRYYFFVIQNTQLDQMFGPMYNLDDNVIDEYHSVYVDQLSDKLTVISNNYPNKEIEVSIISPTNLKDVVTRWTNGKVVYDMFQ